ncbi:MAG: DNA double-strand break repair nuclease NurA [Chloroflexota bacterium]|nr:DNA double-strand break repair nuclease NurA [Chloroflexota bacterium]
MALDLYRTAAQIDAALATADLGPARGRRADAVLAALRDADASTLNVRVEAAQGLLAFLPAEAVEPPGTVFDAPPPPVNFSVVATDGSHIDVNRHLPLRCALINIGGCRLTYGDAPDAELFSRPGLRTTDADLFLQDPDTPSARQAVEGALMGLVRTVEEATALADAVEADGSGLPTLALLDGTLVLWELGGELPPRGRYPDYVRERLLGDGLLAALDRIRDASARQPVAVTSYISLPNSTEVVNLLRLALCDLNPVGHCQTHCRAHVPGARRCDAAHGLTDRELFERTLAPGQRSAVFASRSPVARDAYGPHRVHFFYVNVGEEIGRVEMPAWVALDPALLSLTHALVVDNARRGAGYPVALQEAHEQAVVTGADREAFRNMVERALEGRGLPVYTSQKQRSKRRPWV